MSISEILRDGFSYPFRDNGKMVLLWGAILGVGTDLASALPFAGLFVFLFMAGFFCSTFFGIMESSAGGVDDCPGFPNFSDLLEDLILPFFKVVAVSLFSFLPAIIWMFAGADNLMSSAILFLLVGVGSAYLPMALLAVGILSSFRGMLPDIVIPSIVKAGGLYWVIAGILFLVFLMENFLSHFVEDIFIVGALAIALLSMLTLMINGRLLGLLYLHKEEELEWV